MDKVLLVVEISKEILKLLQYLSDETKIPVKNLMEDFIVDSTNDLCIRFYELDKEAVK